MDVSKKIKNQPAERNRTEFFSYSSASPFRVTSNFGRVAALVSFHRNFNDRKAVNDLAGHLHEVTSSAVLVVHLSAREGGVVLGDWIFSTAAMDAQFAFSYRIQSDDSRFSTLSVQVQGQAGETANLGPMLGHVCRYFRYVLIHVDSSIPTPVLLETVLQSDLSYFFLSQTPESFYEHQLFVREVAEKNGGKQCQLFPIVLLNEGERAQAQGPAGSALDPVFPSSSEKIETRHVHLQPRAFERQLRSLAREIGRCRVGIALSSGGAKGLAHVGVIQVLEENGIEVDAIAGCSMGAYVGAVWAYGYDGMFMERLAREVEQRWGLLRLMDPVIPWEGLMGGFKVKQRLEKSIGDAHFSDLILPLRLVATNLHTLERVTFSSGEVASAVHASIAIPGICAPVRLGTDDFVDGGIVDPLPVDILRKMGVEKVIAVNTIPAPEYLRVTLQLKKEQKAARQEGKQGFSKWAYNTFDFFTHGSIFKNLLRSINAAQMRLAEEASRRADVVIRPVVADAKWHDFTHPGKFITMGRQAALEQLGELKAITKGKTNERISTHYPLARAV